MFTIFRVLNRPSTVGGYKPQNGVQAGNGKPSKAVVSSNTETFMYKVHDLTNGEPHDRSDNRSEKRRDKEEGGAASTVDERTFLRRHAFFITLLVYSMISSLMYAVLGQFRYSFFRGMYSAELREFNTSRQCGVELQPEVQAIENKISAETVKWSLYGSYVTIVPKIIGSLIIGMKSDQTGRRFIFLIPLVTSSIFCIIMAVVIRLELHYGYILIGEFIYSLSGGSSGMHFASYALVSDTHGRNQAAATSTKTTDSKDPTASDGSSSSVETDLDTSRERSRTFKIVLLSILPKFAGSLMSFFTGYVIAYLGFFWSLVIVVGFKIIIFLFAVIFITETGQQKKSTDFLAPLRTIVRAASDPKRKVPLLLVNLGLFFTVLASVEEFEVLHTYEMSPPFCLRSIELGWLSSESRLKGIFAIPLMWAWRRLRLSESTIAGIGLASYTAGAMLLATVRQVWVFYANAPITIPGSLSSSMTKAITSRLIGRSALASTFAVLMAAEELFAFFGGTASNYLYQNTLDTLPTASFYLSACSFTVAMVLFFAQTAYQRRTADVAGTISTLNVPIAPAVKTIKL